jgi:uncharacterized protein
MFTEIQNDMIFRASQFAQSELREIESGHDWWHTKRVWQMSSHIAKNEEADLFICSMAALLHDVSDPKFRKMNDATSQSKTKIFISSLDLDLLVRNAISNIIENMSFGAGIGQDINKSIEFKVVQDADRLDAIGAIGIARAFNYGGFKNRIIHLPDSIPVIYNSTIAYRKNESSTIMHFYEKLLLLKSLMNTETGKGIAQSRHEFMLVFLERFFLEWNEYEGM